MSKILLRTIFVVVLVLSLVPVAQATSNHDVYYIFSFSCPHCRKHDAQLEHWGDSLPSSFRFHSVPVIANSKWQIQAARAYYAAMRINKKKAFLLRDKLFALVQEHSANIDMVANETYYALAQEAGINLNTFKKAWWSDVVKRDVTEAYDTIRELMVTNIPCIAIAGKIVHPDMTGGDYEKMLQLANGYVSRVLDGTINNVK